MDNIEMALKTRQLFMLYDYCNCSTILIEGGSLYIPKDNLEVFKQYALQNEIQVEVFENGDQALITGKKVF